MFVARAFALRSTLPVTVLITSENPGAPWVITKRAKRQITNFILMTMTTCQGGEQMTNDRFKSVEFQLKA